MLTWQPGLPVSPVRWDEWVWKKTLWCCKDIVCYRANRFLYFEVELPAKLLDYFLCIWINKAILINGVCICECEWSPTHACVCVRVHECERVFVCVCIIVYLQMTHYVTWMLLCVWHRACVCTFVAVRLCVLFFSCQHQYQPRAVRRRFLSPLSKNLFEPSGSLSCSSDHSMTPPTLLLYHRCVRAYDFHFALSIYD